MSRTPCFLSVCLRFALTAGAAALLQSAAGAAETISNTHPDHYLRPPSPAESLFSRPRERTKQPPKTSNIVVTSNAPLRVSWRINGQLSQACRRGYFRQRREHHLIAVLDGRTYGAAVGGHHSLVDRQGLAQRSIVYIFKAQGTSTCRVYHRSQ